MLSKLDSIGALEAQHGARLLWGRYLVAELLDDAADFRHLLGIAGGELAAADIEAVLEPDPDIAADHGGHGGKRNLVAAAGQHRPLILVAEQAVGRALHEQRNADGRAPPAPMVAGPRH